MAQVDNEVGDEASGTRATGDADSLLTTSVDRSESVTTVLIAFAANIVVALAKTAAAVLTSSAPLVVEAAHSWADAGNEVLLIIANRRGGKPSDESHPLGYGREVYV